MKQRNSVIICYKEFSYMMLCKPSISAKLGYASLLLQVCSQHYSLKTPYNYETHYEFGLYEMTHNKNLKK